MCSAKMATPTEDIVTQITGSFGRWQLRTILLVFLCKIPSAWFMACVIYTAPTPQKGEYYCKPQRPSWTSTDAARGPALDDWVRMQHPAPETRQTDRHFSVDACTVYEEYLEKNFAAHYRNYTNPFQLPVNGTRGNRQKIIPCESFVHNSDYRSLVTQFDLVCSRQLLVSVTQSFHALGAFFGGLMVFKLLKSMSPHRLMLLGMLGQIFCGSLTGLVATFELHVYFRCLTSLFCAFMYTSGQVILMDITAGTPRVITTTLFELFWSIGLILLPGISIFFDSWSYLYVTISSSLIILVFLHRWIADSPRWLLRHNKIDRALQVLLESAAFNNRALPLNLISELECYAEHLQSAKQATYWSIWDGKTARKYLISVHWAWAGAAVLYNVMLLLIRTLGIEHIHVNTASLGFAEMIGVFVGLYLILYTRRRWLWAGYLMIAAGLFTLFIWLVPQASALKENRRVGLEMIFWIVLKLANSASLSVLTTCTNELVSPEKRPILMLSVSTFSRVFLTVGPFISTLTIFHQLLPITVFASLALFNGVLMCFLNRGFWNCEQPRIEKVLTPNTYRRNSAILLRRSSTCSELSSAGDSGHTNFGFSDGRHRVSISDIWQMDSRFNTIDELESATEGFCGEASSHIRETKNL